MFLRQFYFFLLLKVQFWQIMNRKKNIVFVLFENILPQLPFALYRDWTEVARKSH